MRDAWVEVSTTALRNNLMQVINSVKDGVRVCPVLKAQAYGMTIPTVAKEYHNLGIDIFAVAVLQEALEIRDTIEDCDILVLGHVPSDCYDLAIRNNISLTVYREDMALKLNDVAKECGVKAKVHIKINTGMNRLGFFPTEEDADSITKIVGLDNLDVVGIYTHFAVADEKDKSLTHMQAQRFRSMLNMLEKRNINIPIKHMSNSAAVCDLPEYDSDMVRPGFLLIGFYTSGEVSHERIHLMPTMRLMAKLVSVMKIKAGESIGYSFTRTLDEDTLIGVLPLGYVDGFSYVFSNDYDVIIKGKKCPIIGSICMDQCMVDLSSVPEAQIGDEVIIMGNGSDGATSISEAAQRLGVNEAEILANFPPRLPRRFVP